MNVDITEQRKIEAETTAYKLFMRVAKKISYLEYGKWKIVPDANEPLRKFSLEKQFEWAKIKLVLVPQIYYKRHYTDYNEQTQWRFLIGIQGLFANNHGELLLKTGERLKPRMAKKLLALVNNTYIPRFYQEVMDEKKEREVKAIKAAEFAKNIHSLDGLVSIERSRWESSRYTAHPPTIKKEWPSITDDIVLTPDMVRINLEVKYDLAKKLLEVLNG